MAGAFEKRVKDNRTNSARNMTIVNYARERRYCSMLNHLLTILSAEYPIWLQNTKPLLFPRSLPPRTLPNHTFRRHVVLRCATRPASQQGHYKGGEQAQCCLPGNVRLEEIRHEEACNRRTQSEGCYYGYNKHVCDSWCRCCSGDTEEVTGDGESEEGRQYVRTSQGDISNKY